MNKRKPINKLWAEKPASGDTGTAHDQNSLLSNNLDASQSRAPGARVARQPQSTQRKGQTLRLTRDAWKQLKVLAIDQDRTAHDLLIEAVNDLFSKYGKPPIA